MGGGYKFMWINVELSDNFIMSWFSTASVGIIVTTKYKDSISNKNYEKNIEIQVSNLSFIIFVYTPLIHTSICFFQLQDR